MATDVSSPLASARDNSVALSRGMSMAGGRREEDMGDGFKGGAPNLSLRLTEEKRILRRLVDRISGSCGLP
jgi:hypothetical protein